MKALRGFPLAAVLAVLQPTLGFAQEAANQPAALDAGRPLRVLRPLGQPADHPVSIDHPEGAYLNGLLLEA